MGGVGRSASIRAPPCSCRSALRYGTVTTLRVHVAGRDSRVLRAQSEQRALTKLWIGRPMNPRIVIFEEEQRQLEEVCSKLARDSLAKAIFLLDKNGQILVATGEIAHIDTTSLATLVAGTTAATSSLAKLLGEEEFPVHFHEGKRDNLHVSLVDEEHILTVVFDQRSSLGLVRLRVRKASEKLVVIFEQLALRQADDNGSNLFSEITEEDIDNLFSDSF